MSRQPNGIVLAQSECPKFYEFLESCLAGNLRTDQFFTLLGGVFCGPSLTIKTQPAPHHVTAS